MSVKFIKNLKNLDAYAKHLESSSQGAILNRIGEAIKTEVKVQWDKGNNLDGSKSKPLSPHYKKYKIKTLKIGSVKRDYQYTAQMYDSIYTQISRNRAIVSFKNLQYRNSKNINTNTRDVALENAVRDPRFFRVSNSLRRRVVRYYTREIISSSKENITKIRKTII